MSGDPNFMEMFFGIVVGGDAEDPAEDKAGGVRVHIPEQYGPNVNFKDLPFIRTMAQGNQNGGVSFNTPPERGTAVVGWKRKGHSGTGHMILQGVLSNDIMKNMGVPGGKSLNSLFEEAINHRTSKKAPPKKLKNGTRDGAQIREVQDGEMWAHALVKNIPSSATLWPMSGIFLPQVKNIPTAIQHFTSIMDNSMMSQLPGTLMSLGSMFNKLKESGQYDEIKKELPEEMIGALDSMANLIVSVEIAEEAGFTIGGRVHEETFMANAMLLLKQCRTITDMSDMLHRLQFDVTLFGQDKLEEVSITVDTPYGDLEIILTFEGSLTPNINVAAIISSNSNTANANTANTSTREPEKPIEKNMKSFLGTMKSPSQSFAMSGENMFGDSATQIFDMFNRLTPSTLGTAKKMVETLSTGQKEANHLREIAKIMRDGGLPLSGKGFK
jgi:hypothetical protein